MEEDNRDRLPQERHSFKMTRPFAHSKTTSLKRFLFQAYIGRDSTHHTAHPSIEGALLSLIYW